MWTGAALIAAAGAEPPPLDHARYASSTLWRLGCGCDDCLAVRRRHPLPAAHGLRRRIPQQRRREFLELLASGEVASLAEATERARVTAGQVLGLASRDDDFRDALDEAGMALCAGRQRMLRPGGLPQRLLRTACWRAHRLK